MISPPAGCCVLEDAKLAACHRLRDVEELLPEAQVRPVDAVVLHGVGVADDRERQLQDALVAVLGRGQVDQQPLDQRLDVAGVDKAHLQVELREFRLAIRTQVLVAEAAGDLEVTLDARHHQQLLQLLRALRQGVELAWMQAAGHDKVACAFGRALEQDRRLDLQEVALRQVLADKAHDAMAQRQVLGHAGAADVQIAILEPQRLVHLVAGRADIERRVLGGVEDRHLVGDHLDVTGSQVGVAQPFRPCRHRALHLDHKFGPGL